MLDLPLTLAVRVQLYKVASSPNTFPGPIRHNFCPSFVTSTLPSVNKYLDSKQDEIKES